MSEEMAIERMASDLASLRGYHTKTRVPYLQQNRDTDSMSDIDVMGVNWDGEILAIECKSPGAPNNYENWNKQTRLNDIRDEVKDLSTNIDQIIDSEFESVDQVDRIWFVFKGYLATESRYGRSVEYASRGKIEQKLENEFSVDVTLKPSHLLIEELIEEVSEDMIKRRTRYASPTLELIRQLVAIGNEPSKIESITRQLEAVSKSN